MSYAKNTFPSVCTSSNFACHSNDEQQQSVAKNNSDKPPVELEVKFSGWLKQGNKKGIIFKTVLINNTFYTVGYMNMSCSYSEAFCTDLPITLRPVVEECNKNTPSMYTIGFHDTVTREVTFLFRDIKPLATPIKFRIGFHFVKADYFSDTDPMQLLKDSNNIIWSKPIQL